MHSRTKAAFNKKRDGEKFLYEYQVHHGGYNHRVTKWENVVIGTWEENRDEYVENWQRYTRRRPAAAGS